LQYRKATVDHADHYPTSRPGIAGPATGGAVTAGDALERVGQQGWGPESAELGPWLDRVFRADWVQVLRELAGRPAGVFDDPRDRDYFSPADPLRDFREMGFALRARGMQRLALGDADAYPPLLRGGLAAVRSARNKGGRGSVQAALHVEISLLDGLAEWLNGVNGRPDLVRALLTDVIRHDSESPVEGDDVYWAEQLILRNTLDRVGTWLPVRLARLRPDQVDTGTTADAEGELVTFAWSVPWEKARRERILRVHTHPEMRLPGGWLSDLHLKSLWRAGRQDYREGQDQRAQARRRFAILRLALRLFQLERGAGAASLDRLVPDYLAAVPLDPFTGRPFGYRVSDGETLTPILDDLAIPLSDQDWTSLRVAGALAHPVGGMTGPSFFPPPPRGKSGNQVVARPIMVPLSFPKSLQVRRGDAVLWCAGPDGEDNGGLRPLVAGAAGRDADWIVIIPTVPPGKD
jgi:hypothetical protein